MKNFINKYWKHSAIIVLAVAVFAVVGFIELPHHSAKAQAQTYPNPSIATYDSRSSSGDAADYTLSLPSDGPFTNDFKLELCLYNYNGAKSLCFTSPWATQSLTGAATGAWTVNGSDEPLFTSATGNWSVWGFPGAADSLVNHNDNGADTASFTVIQGAALPTGEVISNLKLGLQLSEDDTGSLMNSTAYDDQGLPCATHVADPTGNDDPGSLGAGYVGGAAYNTMSSQIWAAHTADCDNSFDPDVARMYMSDDLFNAVGVSNNISSTTFNVSSTLTNGFNGSPLEITVQNTGSVPWTSDQPTVIAGSQSGTCDGASGSEPLASDPVGTSCTASINNSSYAIRLQHISGSFGVGANPASYSQVSQQTCTVTGTQSCSVSSCTDEPLCVSQSGYCSVGSCDETHCPMPSDFGGCGGTWMNGCGGTWGNTVQCTTTGGDPNVEPGKSAQFKVNSLTAPTTTGSYKETWQMENNGNPFGSQIIIPIVVTSSAQQSPSTVTSVSVSCSPNSVGMNGTSSCNATVNGTNNPDPNVTWSASDGTMSTKGPSASSVLTAGNTAEMITVTATSAQDPTKAATTQVSVIGTLQAGTIVVESVSAADPSVQVPASWSFFGPIDPCASSAGVCPTSTSGRYTNLSLGNYSIVSEATADPSYTATPTLSPADMQEVTEGATTTFLIEWNTSSTPYYSCSGSGGSCALDATCTSPGNGCYANDNTCGKSCGGGGTQHYSCSGTGNSCALDSSGAYTDSNCDNSCSGGPTYYSCSGSGNSCVADPQGTYSDPSCGGFCTVPPVTYYSCSGSSCEASSTCTSAGNGCYAGDKTCNNSCGGGGTTYYSCTTGCSAIDPTCTSASSNCYVSSATCNSSCPPELPPTISSFTASPGLIVAGESATLAWGTDNASFCGIDPLIGPVSLNSDPANPELVYPTSTTVYVLTCSNPNGSATRDATTTVTVKSSGRKEGN